MGGKGYKPRKDYAGRTVSGDWEDSDRGGGHKSIKRAGGEVEAKSPTYLAHVHNKGKKKVDPKKNPVVDEGYGTVVVQGTKQLGKLAVRQGIKVGGKAGGYAVKKAGKAAAKGAAEVARETGRGALEAAKKRGRKAGEDFVTNVGKQQVIPQTESVAAPAKKPVGKGEKVGKIVGSVAGGMAGGAAVGGPTLGVGALAGGVAGSVAGEKVGGAIGKGVDKVRSKFKKENFSDWRNELTVDEAKVDAGKSPEEKEKVRNVRKFGVSHNVAGHGKLRRSLHKMNRGDKKIPGDKSAWVEMESLQVDENRMAAYTAGAGEGSPASRPTVSKKLADKVSRSSDEHAFGNRKKKDGIRLSPTKKYSGKDKGKVVKRANTTGRGTPVQYRKSHEDPDMGRYQQKVTQGSGSVKDIKSSFSNWRNDLLSEEGYDRMRDARLVKYGIGHDGSDRKGSTSRPTGKQPKGKTVLQKETEKKYGKGATALDIVKKDIEDKHGKGAIMDTKKK